MNPNNAEDYIASEIRKKKLTLRELRRNEAPPEEIIVAQSGMDELLEKYLAISDGKVYAEKIEDIAADFCDELFYELSRPDRDEVKLSRFYDLDATLSVVGGDRFVGKLACVQSIADKFRGLAIEQEVDSIVLDLSLCKGGVIHFDCKSKLKINEDSPRKILQMIDLVRSTLPTTYPYVIKREYFVVQDARPLYHWPERAIPVTKHDNWEPQFKPKVVERPKSATVAVPDAVAAPAPQPEEEGDDEGEDAEESLAEADEEGKEIVDDEPGEGKSPEVEAKGDAEAEAEAQAPPEEVVEEMQEEVVNAQEVVEEEEAPAAEGEGKDES